MSGKKAWPVSEFTLKEVQTLDAGGWKGKQFAGERVPTFQQMIDAVKGKAGLFPETKSPAGYEKLGLSMEKELMAVLKANKLDAPGADPKTPVVVQSFSADSLKALRKDHGCKLPLVLLHSADLSAEKLKAVAGFADGIGPSKAVVQERPGIVADAHAVGLSVDGVGRSAGGRPAGSRRSPTKWPTPSPCGRRTPCSPTTRTCSPSGDAPRPAGYATPHPRRSAAMTLDPDRALSTHSLQLWVVELQAGRPNAAEPVLRRIDASVRRLAATAFKRFPRAGRFADLDDVIQGTLIRLLSALRAIRPDSTQQFYALANTAIRRELLDLIKKFYGPAGAGTHLAGASVGGGEGELDPADEYRPELDSLTAFHEAVERLPAEEREAFGLKYYHGWPLADIAELFQVSVRTVQRWQTSAEGLLRDHLGGA